LAAEKLFFRISPYVAGTTNTTRGKGGRLLFSLKNECCAVVRALQACFAPTNPVLIWVAGTSLSKLTIEELKNCPHLSALFSQHLRQRAPKVVVHAGSGEVVNFDLENPKRSANK
jgi:hypothetical protein